MLRPIARKALRTTKRWWGGSSGDAPLSAPRRVLLNTLPKSGSVFLQQTLSGSLGVPSMYVGNMYSLIDQLSLDRMRHFASGSFVSQNHLAPSPENLRMLEHFGCPVVLHVRDPRQALVSWLYHLDRIRGDAEALLLFSPHLPPNYFAWDFHRKLDWQIDNFLPHMVEWIARWVAIHDAGRLPVLLTTYDELSRDLRGLCRRICEFCAIPADAFRFVEAPKTIENHFRLGDDGEWRRVFSAEQTGRASAMLPAELAQRFGWHPPEGTQTHPAETPRWAA